LLIETVAANFFDSHLPTDSQLIELDLDTHSDVSQDRQDFSANKNVRLRAENRVQSNPQSRVMNSELTHTKIYSREKKSLFSQKNTNSLIDMN